MAFPPLYRAGAAIIESQFGLGGPTAICRALISKGL